MSKLAQIDWLVREVLDMVEQGEEIATAIETIAMVNELNATEKMALILLTPKIN